MNTSQLQCCIDCSSTLKTHIVGVFAADQLPTQLKSGFGFIANTDDHTKEGKHWCCFYCPEPNVVEYFDSYGKPIYYYNQEFPHYLSKYSNVVINSRQLQSVYSDVCGMYCLFFLLQRLNKFSFHDIIDMFCNNTEWNDAYVYNSSVHTFSNCFENRCVYKQSCMPLINYV